MSVIKSQTEELGLAASCHFCYDGETAFQQVVSSIKEALEKADSWAETIQPITLMLLDF